MHALNPYDLTSVSEAHEFLASLPKSHEFTTPELRETYKAFYRALRREVRQLIRDVLLFDWHLIFDGAHLPDNIITSIKYHIQNGAPYYVWQCDKRWYCDSRCPGMPMRWWVIERNPDRCTKWENGQPVQQYRLQHARFPVRTALNLKATFC